MALVFIPVLFFDSYKPQSPSPHTAQNENRAANSQNDFVAVRYLKEYAAYCNKHAEDKNKDWLHYTACEKSTESVIAIFTVILAIATSGLIVVGIAQEIRAHDTARKELRAYVSAISIRGSDGLVQLIVKVKNFGQTPAYNMIVHAFPYTGVTKTDEALRELKEIEHDGSGTRLLHPGEEWDSFQGPVSVLIGPDDMFLVIGRIIYRDIYNRYWVSIFNIFHWTSGNDQPWGENANYEKGPFKNLAEAMTKQ